MMVRRMQVAPAAVVSLVFVLALGAAPASATFPGRSGRIGYAQGNLANIATINPDGSGRRILTSFTGASAEFPRFSSNGNWIVFDAKVTAHPTSDYDIYKMTSTGTHMRRLTSDTSNYDDWGACFSPSGKRIAFISDRAGSPEVWTMNADGSNPQQVTSGMSAEYTSWSPNGRLILFDSSVSGNDEIYEVRPGGAGQRMLTHPPITGSGADWSPDGRRIVFSGSNSGGTNQVWVMDRDGSHRHALTSLTSSAYEPVWSPNGGWIAFDRDVSGTDQVIKIRSDGRRMRKVTTDPSGNSEPGWQPK